MASSSVPARTVIRWGIIGCGDVTEVKSGPAFQKADGSALVAVMRRTRALAEDYARRHGVARSYDNASALVNDPDVDAVYVATPPGAHLEAAKLAAAAGKPAYVEKPMARHAPECTAMIETFAAAQQKLFVAYYRRALPRFLKIKELLESGAVGRVMGVNYRFSSPRGPDLDPQKLPWRLNATDAGGGLLLDVGSHVLDLLDFYFGPLENVRGSAAHFAGQADVEDVVTMTFRTHAGVPGSAMWDFSSAGPEDDLEFTGTKGRLSVAVLNAQPAMLMTGTGEQLIELPNPPHISQPLVQTVVDELLGRGTCPSTGESARRTSEVMDRVLSDYYGGREDAFWERPQNWPGRHR
ncbi:MAG: Gfo/Idh/MocA family oxidoreductase [Opitutaceae bacterium]|nr:Gfo/Idh/MocA family oxidoreductase [Opitutaceae bacterium]